MSRIGKQPVKTPKPPKNIKLNGAFTIAKLVDSSEHVSVQFRGMPDEEFVLLAVAVQEAGEIKVFQVEKEAGLDLQLTFSVNPDGRLYCMTFDGHTTYGGLVCSAIVYDPDFIWDIAAVNLVT